MSGANRNVLDSPLVLPIETDDNGNPCVKVCSDSVPAGLTSQGRINLIPVTPGVWLHIIVPGGGSPLNKRRSWAIQNEPGTGVASNPEAILLNWAPFAPSGAAVGWVVRPGGVKIIDANDNNGTDVYVRSPTASFNIVFEEIS